MKELKIHLGVLEGPGRSFPAARRKALMEFHILNEVRETCGLEAALFSLRGNVVLADFRTARDLAAKLNASAGTAEGPPEPIRAGQLNAMGLIDEILHYVAALYREHIQKDLFSAALLRLEAELGGGAIDALLSAFGVSFPPGEVYAKKRSLADYLAGSTGGESHAALALEELLLLALANLNPAFAPFKFLFNDTVLAEKTVYPEAVEALKNYLASRPPFGPLGQNLWDLLRAPALASPLSLAGQLDYMRKNWGLLVEPFMQRILTGLDVIKEEEKPVFFGPGPTEAYRYDDADFEYERFSQDQEWMPRTVLMAKSTLVWLFQLSQKYSRDITRLDQIPDEELDELARRGFTGLWLIGLWERSGASRTIKQWSGNPEAAASAYSLYDYDIAPELGGWGSLTNLRERCARRGIRLGSDMVPNHTGIDSRWIVEHPDFFLQLPYPPFPTYVFTCGNLSGRDDITVQIEEHYFSRSDAAVVFKRTDNRSGEARYIYHGNDGTSMPWNDTAQIDFLNPEAREAVIQTIIGVCKQFSIVRFDAAMTLAKRHIQRLWYPEPGHGGDIASRAEHAISGDEFNRRIPHEFWREVVDRCAVEAPNTLLLAEAFWMMEGYFVRTLGMHRVYNSAFMNMLKNEENAKYRETIKNTLAFDPEILKRFVNFMNNPDEETAVAQFGKGDKYFGICTLLSTMPGLPMFGHGQIEGFEEKYGMEYRRSYRDEKPDGFLVDRHEREIFPLLKKRRLFSGSADFTLFDLYGHDGPVNENVFAYTNRSGDERALVLYNNAYENAAGWIQQSSTAIPLKDGTCKQDTLFEALRLNARDEYFTLLYEQRSKLWYIRSSKELASQGLFVRLSGYEAQVYLDIREVADAPPGRSGWSDYKWARLCKELGGKGVANIDTAVQDIFLAGLYAPFMDIFEPSRVELFRAYFARPARNGPAHSKGPARKALGKGTPGEVLASFREPIRAFAAVALKYLDGAGRYEPAEYTAPLPEPEDAAACFETWLAGLLGLESGLKKAARSSAASLRDFAPAERPEAPLVALGYGTLRLLSLIAGNRADGKAGAALAGHWQLDRKLAEAFTALGMDKAAARRAAGLARAVLARTRNAGETTAEEYAHTLMLENYNDDDFRELLGVNRFDEATWFSKECFEEALFYGCLFMLPGAGDETLKRIAGIRKLFLGAEEKSDYRFDRLLDLLAPDKEQ
ncbi:MAG: alpha-amylase [Spirochaetaceae bacterium]|nr:alpha-amylase [Spirochaetaceae bacterium]